MLVCDGCDLPWQLGLVEVLDVIDLAVEQIEDIERQLGPGRELAAHPQVGRQRRGGGGLVRDRPKEEKQ